MESFKESGLKPEILRAIADMGFERPTPVQAQTLPLLIDGSEDLIALAQTGTGKTAGFGLPLLQHIEPKNRDTQALILCPTRELCLQITGDLEAFAKYMPDVQVTAVYGGAPLSNQARALKNGAQIVVGTPGRVVDMISRGALILDRVQYFVLDEADEMLNMGFKDDLETIFEYMPAGKRTWLFSATMPPRVEGIAKRFMREAQRISLGKRNEGASTITHEYYMVHAKDRLEALTRILDLHRGFYGVIFCRTRVETTEIAQKLARRGYPAQALNGDLSQQQRDKVMGDFRSGALRMLVATDVAARGLDVEDLTHVINYILPDDLEVYVHRSGRTGRAGKKGTCISILHSREMSKVRDLERTVGKPFELKKVPSASEIGQYHVLKDSEVLIAADAKLKNLGNLPAQVHMLFAGMDREQIIDQWLKWSYMRHVKSDTGNDDINVEPGRQRQERTYDNDRSNRDRPGKPAFKGEARNGRFTDLEVNIGRMQNLKPNKLMGIINDMTGDTSIQFGRIDIFGDRTTIGVDSQRAQDVIRALDGTQFGSKKLRVSLAGGGNKGGGNEFRPRSPKPYTLNKKKFKNSR
jgi:ATP-dependent RNA helicase DeaD